MASNDGYSLIIARLDEFIRKYYKNQLIRGAIYSFGLLLVFYLGLSILEYFGEFNPLIRTILFYTYLLTAAYVLGTFILIPLLKLNRLGKIISYEEAAGIVGEHFNTVQDKLLNVLQLRQHKSDLISEELLQAGINQKIKELHPVPFTSAIDLKQNRHYLKYAIIPLIMGVLIFLVAPRILSNGTDRLIHHGEVFEKPAPFVFQIQNPELKVIQQQDFTLRVKLLGNEIPAEVFIHFDEHEFRLEKENDTSFFYTFRNTRQNLPFYLAGSGFNSRQYELQVLPRPTLMNFEVLLHYPAYLNRKDDIMNNTGDLIIPQGTKVSWGFTTRNSDYLSLRFADTLMMLQPGDENKFSYTRQFLLPTPYTINTGNDRVKGFDSVNYSINVIPDAYPSIEVSEQKDSLHPNALFFSGNIKDDYGLSQLFFHYRHYTSDSAGKSLQNNRDVSLPVQKNQLSQTYIHALDINSLGLKPGDKIEYFFEVFDNDGVHGAKSARTSVMLFKAPTLEELEKQTGKNNQEIKDDLNESIKKAKELQKEINDLNKKVLEKKQLGWEEKKKIEDMLKKQQSLEKKIDEIKEQNQANNEQQNNFQQPDESLLEKQKQLEQLFENIMTPEMKKLFDELQKLMDKMDKTRVQETLEKLKLNDKDLEKELDRTLEQFKQMEAEQKMEKLSENLSEMAKKQDELSKEAENKNNDQQALQEKQQELNKEFEKFKEDAKELEKLNKELENPMNIPDTKQEQEKVSQDQQNASEQLNKGNKKNASKSQKNAAQQMQSMSEKMQEAMQQMEQDQNGEDMQALRQIMENLMNVSFAQEELINESQRVKINNPQYVKLAQKQKKLQDDAKMIEDSLLALSKRNPKVSASINREISAIEMNMAKSIEALAERQTGEAAVREQNAMTSINNLALMLNESLEDMQQQMQQQQKNKSQGQGNCKKPGGKGQKPSQSMANMRKMQEQLNKQIEQMKKMLEQGKQQGGKKPGEKLGNGMGMMPGGNSEQLAKMAAEQEAIRRAMQEALQKLMKNGGQNAGGDITQKMEETENELVNKVITQETIKLLEHEKAEREKEFDEKRQSNEAKNENFSNQNLFLEYKRLKEQELELLKTVPPALNPYYRTKVTRYFNTFNK